MFTESPVFDSWTAKDLLAHVAGWDELFTERITLILAGRVGEITGVDLDARNAALHAERKDWSLGRAVEACVGARQDFLTTLAPMSDEEFHRLRRVGWGETSVRQWAQWRARHDAAHAADLSAWREAQGLGGTVGPKDVLSAALSAAREELLAAAALVPPEERASRPVCGEWTLNDVLGHVADWEWVGVEGLRHMAAGQSPWFEHTENIDARTTPPLRLVRPAGSEEAVAPRPSTDRPPPLAGATGATSRCGNPARRSVSSAPAPA